MQQFIRAGVQDSFVGRRGRVELVSRQQDARLLAPGNEEFRIARDELVILEDRGVVIRSRGVGAGQGQEAANIRRRQG